MEQLTSSTKYRGSVKARLNPCLDIRAVHRSPMSCVRPFVVFDMLVDQCARMYTYDCCYRRARSSSSWSTLAPPRHATSDATPVGKQSGNRVVADCVHCRPAAPTVQSRERHCARHDTIANINQVGHHATTSTRQLQPCLGTPTAMAIRTAATALPIVCVAMISMTAVATPVPTSARGPGDPAGMEALGHRVPLLAFEAPAD